MVRALLLGVLLTQTLAPRAAIGQSSPDVAARVLFDAGLALVEARDFEGAYATFERSFALVPRAGTAFNLATVGLQLGRIDDARTWLRRAEALDAQGERRAEIDALWASIARREVASAPVPETPSDSSPAITPPDIGAPPSIPTPPVSLSYRRPSAPFAALTVGGLFFVAGVTLTGFGARDAWFVGHNDFEGDGLAWEQRQDRVPMRLGVGISLTTVGTSTLVAVLVRARWRRTTISNVSVTPGANRTGIFSSVSGAF